MVAAIPEHSLPNGDTMTIPSAYRAATDEDTRSVLNFMSASPSTNLTLEFYVVPVVWMNAVVPFLTGETLDRPSLEISNTPLIVAEHAVSSSSSSSDDEVMNINDKKRKIRRRKWADKQQQQQNDDNPELKSGLIHDKDYYLVGPNVWILLSSKFGYDYSLPRPCVSSPMAESRLGVQVYPNGSFQDLVPVPASGHFSFGATPPVVADDTDFSVSQGDDLFPDGNDGVIHESMESLFANRSGRPLLALPPSTTATHQDDDMEFETMEPASFSSQKRKRYASGLGNLGNTCFMNSTLQCLAHTDPLRRYFITDEYQRDLNRQNALGTGGELASQFASLLKAMWITHRTSTFGSDTVFPREFKVALGKHAEQFMGYDQHDSQEFATYLLDALHEDTNRITKKPYIEKPEQKEEETDDEAADMAWKLHLQREDSKVLENFMGQVKSRVQCPTPGCGRVSTTFDPFMYLSVPIPGSTERAIPVTLVTLKDGNWTFNVRLNKAASIEQLQKKVAEKYNELRGANLVMENLISCDIWNHNVYSFHDYDTCVDVIRDTDTTYIYELKSIQDVMIDAPDVSDNTLAMDALKKPKSTHRHHYRLDIRTLNKLNKGDEWIDSLSSYMSAPTGLNAILNPKRSSHDQRVAFYQKLEAFIDLCHSSSDAHNDSEGTEMATTNDENPQEESRSNHDLLPSLQERCQSSRTFRNVSEATDLAILEFCSKLLRKRILELLDESTSKYKDGIVIEVVMRHRNEFASPRAVSYSNRSSTGDFSAPLCLRVPPNMTVYGLREELARRLSKYLKTNYLCREAPPPPLGEQLDSKTASDVTPDESNEGSDQYGIMSMEGTDEKKSSDDDSTNHNLSSRSLFDFGSPDLTIMRQIPLSFARHTLTRQNTRLDRKLGMLDNVGFGSLDSHPMTLASRDDESEQHTIAEVVGDKGTVYLNWSQELCRRSFHFEKYETAETVESPEVAARNAAKKTITVSDCIEKYCHKEQLDDTDLWFCNRCKEHVRAWKQFHLYRSPPILIIHLKRFQFSSTTHRRDKIDVFVDFPLTGLDLTNEFTSWIEDEKPVYDCYAVSNHFGGLGGGHYTTYALSDEGTWCNFDDSRVTTEVDPKEVVSSAAYVLYYRRRDVVLDGPEDLNPPLPAIVHDSYFQPQEDDNDHIPFGVDLDTNADTDMQSTTSSNKSSASSAMDTLDPTGDFNRGDPDFIQSILNSPDEFPSQ